MPKKSDPSLKTGPLASFDFPTPFVEGEYGEGCVPFTRVEQQLLLAMGAIKSKPLWWTKIKDLTVRAKWEEELKAGFVSFLSAPETWSYVGAGAEVLNEETRAAAAAKWAAIILEELVEAAGSVQVSVGANGGTAFYAPGPVVGTWMSDSAVGNDLKADLARLVAPLESPVDPFTEQPVERDYHPGSGKQVIDIVHPSLYPLVRGKSLTVTPDAENETIFSWRSTIGTGTVFPVHEDKTEKKRWGPPEFFSKKFQWLPSEIDVVSESPGQDDGAREGGEPVPTPVCKARFRSYINNLHPQDNTELYRALERIFAEAFVPLFNNVLSDMVSELRNVRRHQQSMNEDDLYPKFVRGNEEDEDYNEDEAWEDYHDNRVPRVNTVAVMKTRDAFEHEQRIAKANAERWKREFTPATKAERVRIGEGPKPTRLQVIVKLATIELTPERPTYSGGSWHVEGMENEAIVASGIYYWHSENVSGGPEGSSSEEPTVLSFRTSVCEPDYEQSDDKGVEAVYGLANEEALIQSLGSVQTIEGRCLAWPNTLQHQVQPFRLSDPSKNGYRKILVFFLADPSKRVVSTSSVPPQQEEWMLREILAKKVAEDEALAKGTAPAVFRDRDLLGEVLGFGWHFSRSDALSVREELMKERKVFTDDTMKEAYERPFSLCEH